MAVRGEIFARISCGEATSTSSTPSIFMPSSYWLREWLGMITWSLALV